MWNIRNFVRHDNSIFNPRVNTFNGGKDNLLRYEFPLMQWSIAQIQKVFGEDIRIVRISLFIIGLISILSFVIIINHIFNDWHTAIFSAILLQYSPVFYYYTINPIPDNLALAFSFVYIAFILKHRKSSKKHHLIIASLALMFASLCKLPFLMVSIISISFFLTDIKKDKKILLRLRQYALPQFSFLLPTIAWYSWAIPTWSGNPVLTGQLNEKFILSEYLDIFIYHCIIMFPCILISLPIWIVTFMGLKNYSKKWKEQRWLITLMGVTFLYLILEFKPIGKAHDYYMLPFLPWIFILVGYGVSRILKFKNGILFICLTCIFSSIYTAKTAKNKWSIEKSHFNSDVFFFSEELKNVVPNDEKCIILNDISSYIFSYRIDKMGYVFKSDYLPIEWIDDMVRNYNVSYMYSDSRKIDESLELKKYIQEVILHKGSIKVVKLRLPVETNI